MSVNNKTTQNYFSSFTVFNHIWHGNNVNQALLHHFVYFFVNNIYLYIKYLNWTLFYNKITYKAMLEYLKCLTVYGIVTVSVFFCKNKCNFTLHYIYYY